MILNKYLWLVFMLFPALASANNEFNLVIEDFDHYLETQKLPKPIKADTQPKPSAVISSSSGAGQANVTNTHSTTMSASKAFVPLQSNRVSPTQTGKTVQATAVQSQPVDAVLSKKNIERNKMILADIRKQNYLRYDDNMYFKFLKQGTLVPSIEDKVVTFTLREELTDGTVTVDHGKANPVVAAYRKLPLPLNLLVAKAGVKGKIKVYITPEGGYGKAGIPGKIPPESMSILTLEVLDIK